MRIRKYRLDERGRAMTQEAKQEIFTRLTTPIVMYGITKLGTKKVDRTFEAVAKKHGMTIDEVMDEYERQFAEAIR